jgi:hypothetical protein
VKKVIRKDIFWVVLILGLVLLQTRFLFAPGFYTFSDESHIANLYEMIRATSGGQFPPRWAPDMSFNFGYPLFNFYYPLPFYLGAIFPMVFKSSLIFSLKSVFFLSVLLSGIAFYFLCRKFFSRLVSFSSTVVYLYTPYRAVDLYVRGAVGEMWGFVFMPLVLLLALNLMEKRTLRTVVFLAPSIAGLFLAHNLTPIIFLPVLAIFIAVYVLTSSPARERSKTLMSVFLAIILGLAISAYYWLPALAEKKFIQPGTPFNPFDHFPFIKQLIIPSWGYGASVWGPGDQMSFQIGVVNLLAVAGGLLLLAVGWKKITKVNRWILCTSILLFLIVIFLMNVRSWFIWRLLPLGDYIQFPWRLLMITTFISSLLVGFTGRLSKLMPLGLAVLSLVLTFNYFKPGKSVSVDDNYYLRRFFINRDTSGESKELSPEYTNYSEDYLPLTVWTEKRPNSLPEKIEVSDKAATLSWEEKTPTSFQIEINTPKASGLTINSYYFPGWEALVDGRKATIIPIKPYGQMKIEIPAGQHSVQVIFKESLLRKIADGISLIGLVGFFLLLNPKVKFGLKR